VSKLLIPIDLGVYLDMIFIDLYGVIMKWVMDLGRN
jgi:hypothetical protein